MISIPFAEIGHWLLWAVGLICLFILILLAVAFVITSLIQIHAEISIRTVNVKVRGRVFVQLKMPFYDSVLFHFDDLESEQNTESDDESNDESGDELIDSTESAAPIRHESAPSDAAESAGFSNEEKEAPAFESNTKTESDSVEEEKEPASEKSENRFEDLFDQDPLSDLSDAYEEIQRYVDLSDPRAFVSDSISAAVRISKSSARLISGCLLRVNIQKLSARSVVGLSDPANTALLFGAFHSFKASVYAFLIEAESNSRSSRRRKKAGELAAAIEENVVFVPDLENKKFEADADLFISFRLSNLFNPVLRASLNKNTRWVLRHYVFKYYIRQYLKTLKAERKERKKVKKAAKKETKKGGKKEAKGSENQKSDV